MLVLVWGTRPEALKLGPIAAALKAAHIPYRSISTGQHTSLLAGGPALTDLADSESLGLPTTGELVEWPIRANWALQAMFKNRGATLVVVQGDTMSALAGALAAARLRIPVAHVEAGVRSGDLENPFPEERFRRQITQHATYHFAPTLTAFDNLVAEGVGREAIFLTGNPIVSAIARYSDAQPVQAPDMRVLFTMHRREWLNGGVREVLDGLTESAECYQELEIMWPMHPGVAKQLPSSWTQQLPRNVRLVAPLDYRPMLRTLAQSLGLATDSGGLQEEAACLGVPCAVLRYVTDRPESVEAGVARMFPPSRVGVTDAFTALRERRIRREATNLYGKPDAAEKIAKILGGFVMADSARPAMPVPHGDD